MIDENELYKLGKIIKIIFKKSNYNDLDINEKLMFRF